MIYAHLATIKSREDNCLQVVNDILPHVDKLYIYFSKGYESIPLWTQSILAGDIQSKIVPILPKNDMGDAGKFERHHEEGYHVTIDDDIFYPKDFIERIVDGCKRHGKPVTFHGRSFGRPPVSSYYKDHVKHYKLTGDVPMDTEVQFPGTGCFCYHTDQVRFSLVDFPKANMADVWVGRKLKGIGCVCLAHDAGWVRLQDVGDDGIWGDYRDSGDDREQCRIVNEYLAA